MPQLNYQTAGESHGPGLVTIVSGMPAGIDLDLDFINAELHRRQGGYGRGARQRIESDSIEVLSGIRRGRTMGSPIAMLIRNNDSRLDDLVKTPPIYTPRPGHADLTGAIKYGYGELRIALERASARETTMRVAVGAVCEKLLAEFGIVIGGYVTQIGGVTVSLDPDMTYEQRITDAEVSDVRCPDPATSERMHEEIRQAKIDKDTLGGVIEVVALNVPPGLGSHVHYDRRLDGKIVAAMVSVHAMKGAEIGSAFENAGKRGSNVHDEISVDEHGVLHRTTNRAGGLEGGITTGEPIVCRVAMKPISTVMKSLESVNLATGQAENTVYERSDFCATPRAVPILESMMAYVIADALIEKLGGDSLSEMRPRFDSLRRARLSDLPMDNVEWRFEYPE